jgi:hypothetical protein
MKHAMLMAVLLTHAGVWANDTDDTFVFAGKCPNGESYRLLSYQKSAGTSSQSFYDYEGPVGRGTVQSDTPPKVMAVRVCRKAAEIINTHYWE